eukprot:CAMPEP_0206032606 /NCGR_PEP_ID=MMETSP1466-20131121/53_1 /ASSEMBLY_ACC=CAM_ASM_001126 /TAXON_ID=44452 /ORGANISM="Pavlova gyrans, Strain CCMP608" /LENGTH=203 /DNA_ID=CAMNT_0053406733 /DNA_START=296 /DNA_END=903 /DNA_ORIENTATION=-
MHALDGLEDGVNHGSGRVSPARRILLRVGDGNVLHHAVLDDHRRALATSVAEDAHGPSVGELQVERLGQLATRVREERDHRASNARVLRPGLHHRTIVDAKDEHLVDPLGLESRLLLKVVGDLLRGSHGGEGPGQTKENRLLALHAFCHVHLLRWKEVVHLDRRDLVADSNGTGRRRAETGVAGARGEAPEGLGGAQHQGLTT